MYFSNSHESRDLPIPATPTTDTSFARFSSALAWKRSLTSRNSAVAADERRLQPGGRAALAASLGRDPQGLPQRHGLCLALELVLARVGVGDRGLGGAPGRLADEHHSRLGRRLDARGGVDEVARHHPLTLGAHRDGGLTREHARARRQIRVDRGHGRDELECGAHRALGVVLVRDRRAPDGHHRVADELLERAAVALDDLTSDVEVAGQELARVLRVARLGGRREAHQVDEEHGDESPLGCCMGTPASPRVRQRSARSALNRIPRRSAHPVRSEPSTTDR